MLDETEVVAANIALVSLIGVQPIGQPPSAYRIYPQTEIVGLAAAAAQLSRMPGPLSCDAGVASGTLEVRCRRIEGREELSGYQLQIDRLKYNTGVIGELVAMLESEPGAQARFHGGGVSILGRARDVRRWQEKYVLDMGHGMSISHADRAGREKGKPAAEVHFGPATSTPR